MTWRLADQVHAVAIDDDVVLLDVATDYVCLPGAARLLTVAPDRSIEAHDSSAIEALHREGLIVRDAPQPSALALPRLRRSAWRAAQSTPPKLGQGLAALAASARAQRQFRHARLPQLLTYRPAISAATTMSSDLQAEIEAFAWLAPWLPHQGVCLMRSLRLLHFLARRGHGAHWVFGVRTWPFSAHCWLQVGDVVLDDDIEHARAYHPILTV